MQVRGLAVSQKYCVCFSEKTVAVYQFSMDNKDSLSVQSVGRDVFEIIHIMSLILFPPGTFQCECESVGVFEESLVVMEQQRVTMRTMQGTVKQILFILPTEGEPIIMATFRHFVAGITSEGALRLWDVSRR